MKDKQKDFRTEKYIRYGIRKYSFGAASVAIAAGLMFLGNGAVSATEVQDTETTVAATSAKKDNQNSAEVKPETGKTAEAKPEVKAEESKKVNKATLEASIATLESKLSTAKYADVTVVNSAKEVLVTAKAALAKAEASQADVDAQAATVSALSTVVTESNTAGFDKKEAAEKEAAKAEAEKTATPVEKALSVATTTLTQVSSEAEVTNKLAETELAKADVKEENKAAVTAAVAKNQAVLTETKALLADKSVTKEQVDAQLERLNESILAVYNELKNTGIGRDGRYGVALSANEGYTADSTALRKENGEFDGSTGKSYKVLDGNDKYKIYVHGYQSDNTDVPAANSGQAGISGRTDIPLSKTEAQKLGREAALWKGKLRATGKTNGNTIWGAGGAYEYLATEIYGYTYEQGNHYVYITDAKKRFTLSPEAEAAGYKIKDIQLSNLIPGTGYNEKTDTVEGYVASTLQNGVYDMRYIVTVEKDGQSQQVTFRDLTAGWIGWQDSTAPLIKGTSTMVTIGDEVNHNIKYVDNDGMSRDERTGYVYRSNGEKVVAGSKTAPGGTNGATFTAVDGSKVNTQNGPQTVTAHTALNGNFTGSKTSINDVVPGLNYDPKTGDITGTASKAGIYTANVYAKDYNNTTNAKNQDWNMYGQEAHENITIAVAPKITVSNVEAYATKVPVSVSNGANKAEITMPDGTVTKLVVKDGKWTVAAGTTNTAVKEGDQLGDASAIADSKINIPVTSDSTQYVGVDSIVAKATTDKVHADLQREVVKVKDANNKEYTATFNSATGKYALANEDAYVLKDNGDGTTTLTERRVYTDAKADGSVDYIVYEFTRTWNATSSAATLTEKVAEIRKNGEVTAVGDVTRTVTALPKAQTADTKGVTVTVTYDSATNKWTASDGSTVTAEKSNAGWKISTDSGFKGYVAFREATGTDVASIQNDKPEGTSTSYADTQGNSVDLLKSSKANVAFEDKIDDESDDAQSETIKTKLTVTSPSGAKKEFNLAEAEEKAFIQAQRTAAEKTKAAAEAIANARGANNELAKIQELVDRQDRIVEDAQKALDDLNLRTISPTAQDLAEKKLKAAKEQQASLKAELDKAKAGLPDVEAKVKSARDEALAAEKAVETAREALKTAAEKNLANPEIAAYTLGEYGSYKVTVRSVDSNGVVTTPTVGKTDSGEVTEDAVAETTYYIVVSKPEKSSGAEAQKQADSMEKGFKTGLPNDAEVSDYKLVDPESGKKVNSVTTDEGTYEIDENTGKVNFTPAPGFIGTAKPLTVSANVTLTGDDGQPVVVESSTTYTPTVYGVKPSNDETKGKQGQTQESKSGKDRFSELNTGTNTPDGTNVDWTTAKYSLEGADEEGKIVVKGEGTYTIDKDGKVTFTPEPSFKGKAQGVEVKVAVTATDLEGNKVEVTSSGNYTPEVEEVEPTAEPKETSGKQGKPQTQDATTMFKEGDETAPIDKSTIKLVDPTGAEVTTMPALKDGKEVGTYTLDPETRVITFQPNKDFTGTPDPAKVTAADKNGTKVETTYTPTVTPVVPEGQDKTTTNLQGKPQQSRVTFTPGDNEFPIDDKVPATFEDGTTKKVVPGEGTYTVDPDGTVHFQPEEQFTGVAKGVTVKRVDTNGTPATAKYTPIVKPVVPEGFDNVTTGVQGQEQNGKPYFKPGNEAVPIDYDKPATLLDPETKQPVPSNELPAKDPEGNVIGKYTLDPTTGVVKFTPIDKSYVGPVQPVTVQRVDKNNTPATADYTPVIVGVKPTAKPAESTDVQGATQKQPITFKGGTADLEDPVGNPIKSDPVPINPGSVTLVGENGQPTDEVVVKDPKDPSKVIGKYTLVKEPGKDPVAVYTPTDKTYVGQVPPVTIEAKDTNGTPVKTTYTPTIKPVKPTATPAKTTDIQGKAQTGLPEFKGGKVTVNGEEKVVPIDETKAPKLIEPKTGNPVDSVTVEGEGTYTIEDGKVKFQPQPQFTGTATGVEVQREDTNGTPVKAKYTPTVTPVKPTGEDVTSEDIQGAEQNGTPKFTPGNPDVAITITDDQPAKLIDPETGKPTDKNKVVIPGEGTYTIDPKSGEVKFQPEPQFSGQATGVTVQVKDANGTPVEASYTPKVKGVTPTATPAKSKGIQGKPQTGLPEFKGGTVTVNGVPKTVEIDETKAPKLLDPETGEPTDEPVVIPGEGTYTIEDGKVKFQPEPQFTGKGEGVEVQRVDKNGTPVTAKYTPKVVPVTPTGEDKTSVGPKGQPQTGTPEFQGGSVKINGKEETVEIDKDVPAKLVDPKTGNPVDSVTVEGEGTYTIDKDGKVTFTPEPEFLGTATGVTVQRVDKNGTEVTAKYTPTVTPVTATVDKTTEGPKNTPQSETPEFTGDVDLDVPPTFSDGSTKMVVDGEGTYTIDKDGKVTFTPEADYVGTGEGVTVVRKDKAGKTIAAKYTPTVRPGTDYVDENGKEIPGFPSKDGEKPKVDIPGYRYKETITDEHGNTRHIYEQVKTFFKDKDGNPIPKVPTEKGEQPKKDIPGYRFVETKPLPNGDTEHIYEQVKTFFKDKDGNPIPNTPTEEGEQPKKDIPGYRFVETKPLPNGDVEHVYEKVTPPAPTPSPVPQPNPGNQNITIWTDENGNPVKPSEPGSKEPGTIPGYEYVKTVTDPNGSIRHIFRKVQTPTPVEPATPAMPEQPAQPQVPATPVQPAQPVQATATKEAEAKRELPNTGTEDNASLAALGLLGVLSGFGLVARKKKED
ncbi:YSIRK-type signal peptide-containing protein [Streptococcus mitis]|uniref:Major cell-surface adhesin PAc n=1 Tax=Streptococcus mitis TaxID=28037 RepID=A0A3R9JPT8_STRMT|nr:YSIRK-type signal peptide-containing protein [Streptococcus mitis]RSI84457.1 Major cell-surface adhesin PAc precursor [Streptococcus mitis]RSI90320.1 Major cell-surface adhesin PAc precursor [Streptococcus mitis]